MSATDLAPFLDHPLVRGLVQAIAREVAAELRGTSAEQPMAPLLTKQGLATALDCSTATIDRLAREGRVPYRLVGDRRRFDLEEVRAALPFTPAGRAEAKPGLTKTTDPAGPPVRWAKRRKGAS